ncbi:ankyrin repeat-containing domain protein [Aspergillus californicus]
MQLLRCGRRLDVNARTYLGESALSLAASKGHLRVVELLLRDGRVDPNEVDKMGRTAFWCAASAGQTEIVARLLKDRVLTQLKDENGKDALDAASEHHHFNVVLLIQRMLREWERESRST